MVAHLLHLVHLAHLAHLVQALLRRPHLFASGSVGAKHQRDVSPGSSTQRVRGLSPDGAPGWQRHYYQNQSWYCYCSSLR